MGQKVHPNLFRLGISTQHSSQWFTKVGHHYSATLQEDMFIRTFFEKKTLHQASGAPRQSGKTRSSAPNSDGSTSLTTSKNCTIHSIQIQRKNTALLLTLEATRPQEILVHLEEWKKELAKELASHRASSLPVTHQAQLGSTPSAETLQPSAGILQTGRARNTENTTLSANSIFCILSQPKEISAQSIAHSVKEKLEERLPFRKAMKNSIRLAKSRGLKGMKIEISGRLNGAEIARTEWDRYGSVSLQTLRTPIDYYAGIAHTIYGVLGIKVWVQ